MDSCHFEGQLDKCNKEAKRRNKAMASKGNERTNDEVVVIKSQKGSARAKQLAKAKAFQESNDPGRDQEAQ